MINPEGQDKIEPIFALDIGTRSVIGIVGVPDGDFFRVLAVEREEHTKRAMIDGQIEDIEQTSKIVDIVKARLEEKLGIVLKNVFVAAAGRALRTQRASYQMALEPKEAISDDKVVELELLAIQEARAAIPEEGRESLYCVGHSVVQYWLDDYPLSTLLNHRGKQAKVEIIATFLPNEVVESLYTAMEKCGLTVANVTLEPIAAMNAIIPAELRMLNLALVDVGAGTSDIAISDAGSVSAYTMATVAGDEITETIVRDFLVDFATAERMKIELSKNLGNIEYQDILGFTYNISTVEIMQKITPAIENLASVVCDKIIEMNEKAPAAVFLVGGGSQTPNLCSNVAKLLDIAENKVAVGGNNYMKKMVETSQDVKGPEFATPVGIALTAMMTTARDSCTVSINGTKKHVYKRGSLTVMDMLMMSGYKQNQIIGRAGQSITYEVNAQKKIARGGHPTTAVIMVNKKEASISTPVSTGDEITFEPAATGEDAAPTIKSVIPDWQQFSVSLNGVKVLAGSLAQINGSLAEEEQRIHNMDVIESYRVVTLGDVCAETNIDMNQYRFFINGMEQGAEYMLCPDDDVLYFTASKKDALENLAETADVKIKPKANPEEAEAPEHRTGSPITVSINSRKVELYPKEEGTPYLFLDMLNLVDIDPSKPQGNIVLKIDGKNASYLDIIRNGSIVEIYWDKR